MITCYHCGRPVFLHSEGDDIVEHYQECLLESNKRILEQDAEIEALGRHEEQ
jgi:hypothetical protein